MAPLAWIRRITSELPESSIIPLFGNAPPFDLSHLAKALASRFEISHFQIHTKEHEWKEAADATKGLGTNILFIPISVSPLGTVFWAMSREDVIKLTSWVMKKGNRARALSSEILQEGFYRYLILEALYAVQEMAPFKDLTLQISEEELSSRSFCIDVEMDLDHKSCWGRLLIPTEFRSEWIKHFSHMPSEYIPAEIARQTLLTVGIKTGSVILHQDEWKKLKLGDFILLDQGSYDPQNETGVAMLMLRTTPLFNVKISQNKLELSDYAFYYEDNMDESREVPPADTEQLKSDEGEVVALKELPLYVTVEIARLKITLEQLMQLTPGNTLEIPVHPDQGVSLTVNGSKVGRAELVHLGEQLGLRILEIG